MKPNFDCAGNTIANGELFVIRPILTAARLRSFRIATIAIAVAILGLSEILAQPADPLTGTVDPSNVYSLPQLLPASPEPSLFVKSGVGIANLSTGAATANIPLYTIKVKDFSFPISLSYSTQGLKADEASSRVGYGWVMNATGMITRSVKGAPDELVQHRLALPSSFQGNSDALFNYLEQAADAGTGAGFDTGNDTQPDEFQFHVNGYSGKFVLDTDNATARVTSTSNVKINYLYKPYPKDSILITITTPDGVIYHFGKAFEKTASHPFTNFRGNTVIKTAFFLDRIDLPTGEYIIFNYTPINFGVNTGYTQTNTFLESASDDGISDCPHPPNSYTSTPNNIGYYSNYLNNITASNGLTINFSYSGRADSGGDNRLDSMRVVGLKKYIFEYYESSANSTVSTGRFFLTKVSDVTLGTGVGKSLDYTFDYNHKEDVPMPSTCGQDYLGFCNNLTGGGSLGSLIPTDILPFTTVDFSFREPNDYYATYGTLNYIKYPTGGTEEFFYEGNTQSQTVTVPVPPVVIPYGLSDMPGGGSSVYHTYAPVLYTVNNITVPFDQTVTLNLVAYDADPDDNDNDYGATDQLTGHVRMTASVNLYDGGNNLIVNLACGGYNPASTTVYLQTGTTYRMEMTVQSYTEHASVSLNVVLANASSRQETSNVSIPGVRLKQIRYTDPFTSNTHYKYYKYAALSDLTQSSGNAVRLGFKSNSNQLLLCATGTVNIGQSYVVLDIYSSNSTSQSYGYAGSGSNIYYSTVVESDDPNFANGGTEYTFYPNDDGGNQNLLRGTTIPYMPNGQHPTLSGVLAQTYVFNSAMYPVKIEQNLYDQIIDDSNIVTSIYVLKEWDPGVVATDSRYVDIRMTAFDVVRSDYASYWHRLSAKVEMDYSSNGLVTQQTNYYYGSPANVLPDSTVTVDSKGSKVKTIMAYPNTYQPADDGYSFGYAALTSKNILTPVVQQSSYLNGTLQQQKQVYYHDWFGNNSIVEPQKIQVKESPGDVLHDAVVFNQYSASGNPQQLQKANDIPVAYLWDESLSQPIAEIKNATASQVAFTSFENNANGNWILSGSVNANSGITGTHSFSGTLQYTITTGGSYIVSLWTTTTTATVNSSAGTLIRSSKGWNLYQWTLTNPGLITVSGSNLDEVRLSPAGSMMETFTYKPFVGLAAKGDENNRITYFYYDPMGRLTAAKDSNDKTLKTYQYHYQH